MMRPIIVNILKFINKIAFKKILYSFIFMMFSIGVARVWNDEVYVLMLLGIQVICAVLNVKTISVITSNQLTQKDTLKYLYNLPLSKVEAPLIMAYQTLISLTPLMFPLIFYFVNFDFDRESKMILGTALVIPLIYIIVSFVDYKRRILKNYESGFQQQLNKTERYARNIDIAVKYFSISLVVIMSIFFMITSLIFFKVSFRYVLIPIILISSIFLFLRYIINISEKKYLDKLKVYTMSKPRFVIYHAIIFSILIAINYQSTKFYRGHEILKQLTEEPELAIKAIETEPTLVNYKNRYGMTPILIAIFKKDYDLYKELLNLGAKPDKQMIQTGDKYNGLNSLTLAIRRNDLRIVQDLILFQGIDPKIKYKRNKNQSLTLALGRCENYKTLAFLLSLKSMNKLNNKTLTLPVNMLDYSIGKGCLMNSIIISKYLKKTMPKYFKSFSEVLNTIETPSVEHQRFLYHLNEL
jgi:hypothetical protein